jgi:hypothetical protein
MGLFSYVVARDYGFAPNPFGGTCTLATCKPEIRKRAGVGDWVVGIASTGDAGAARKLVYAMCVDEVLTYDEYWSRVDCQGKKPSQCGSMKQLFGDNIYHHNRNGAWMQADSHHSLKDGTPNQRNIDNDTQSDGVLLSRRFAYWGSNAISIPAHLLDRDGESLLIVRGYRRHFSDEFIAAFVSWFDGLQMQGYLGAPFRWKASTEKWARSR